MAVASRWHEPGWWALLEALCSFSMALFPHFSHHTFTEFSCIDGIFIVMAVIWGGIFEGIAPDRFDIIGAAIALVGVAIIFYMPRKERNLFGHSRIIIQAPSPPLITLTLFFAAAIAEIGGGYLVWLWLREKKTIALGALGASSSLYTESFQRYSQQSLVEYMQHMAAYS